MMRTAGACKSTRPCGKTSREWEKEPVLIGIGESQFFCKRSAWEGVERALEEGGAGARKD